ncbi:GrpB family protein [Nonomuraea longicatena]|uniref:GrpB family protein n=1 Tax=Nonomuraea longicatena TaxID=83682 RepID=A0ABP4B0P1_9ACTN
MSMSEEEIRKAHVGAPTRLDGQVTLVDHDPAWPRHYAVTAAAVRDALGEVAVEHVGSTSVPGLPAKPILDVLLCLDDPADESAYVPALAPLGFALHIREPEWYEHRVLKREAGPMPVNLHVLPTDCEEVRRMLAFRDRLRSDERDRELYAATKRELAGRTWAYVQNYADAKSEVVEAVLARALAT